MNYIELIKRFWQCNNELPIGCNATAMYFYLLELCNSLNWKETFKHSDRRISIELDISINTVKNAKNKLKQLGLIDFKKPENTSRGIDGCTVYSFKTLSKFDSVTDSVTDSVDGCLNKLNKTKLNKIINSNELINENPHFFEIWKNWSNKKKSFEKDLKTFKSKIKGIVVDFENLIKLSKQCDKNIYLQTWLNDLFPKNQKENPQTSENWKTNFEIYIQDLRNAFNSIKNDTEFIESMQKYHNNLDIILTIEKSCVKYWATMEGWEKKRKSKIENIDWKKTFKNGLDQSFNKVYKQKDND